MDAKPGLLQQVRDELQTKHYSYRAEQQYLGWIRRFILHHGKRHPREANSENPAAVRAVYAANLKRLGDAYRKYDRDNFFNSNETVSF